MSFTIVLSGTSNILTANFNPPIYIDDGDYVVGLINFETFNAIPNIDERNNQFSIEGLTITIPTGAYELADINKYIKERYQQAKDVTINISPNHNTLHTILESNRQVEFYEGTIAKILGFKDRILPPGRHISDYPAEIIKVNAISVDCSIAAGSYYNGKPAHIIHQFFPSVGPGFKIIEIPQNIIYFPVNVKILSHITIQICDQNGELINFSGETVTIRLHIRKISE